MFEKWQVLSQNGSSMSEILWVEETSAGECLAVEKDTKEKLVLPEKNRVNALKYLQADLGQVGTKRVVNLAMDWCYWTYIKKCMNI